MLVLGAAHPAVAGIDSGDPLDPAKAMIADGIASNAATAQENKAEMEAVLPVLLTDPGSYCQPVPVIFKGTPQVRTSADPVDAREIGEGVAACASSDNLAMQITAQAWVFADGVWKWKFTGAAAYCNAENTSVDATACTLNHEYSLDHWSLNRWHRQVFTITSPIFKPDGSMYSFPSPSYFVAKCSQSDPNACRLGESP